MKRVLTIVSLCAALTAPSGHAASFTVGVEANDYMPISKGEGGNYSGYARDVLDAFAAKYGHTFSYKPYPVNRLFDEFAVQKSLDFKFPDNPYWAGDAKKGLSITYSKGVVAVTEGLLVLPTNKGKLSSVSKIATLRGFTPFPYLDQIKSKKVAVTEVNAAEAAIKLGEAGRVDGVYLGTLAANYIMAETLKQPGVLVFDPALPNSTNDFSLSTLSHPEVIKQLDEFLAKEKDLIGKLKAKYKIVE
ncbi:transporter substrate-binding domain-containing protein [Curvibacter sp. APW13]|uniref:substrate-binding periplasmic protein n=1 Tax=Curvibacter sp. APW13 TaxID=3077236 RepID=UPI0028DE6C14|nr:transporter substrate-binding domain-containing protein [Curvibacter sp. APW13]MDT8991092.1 transporter substrate-binding domain-containing protein [Curvibacter sp. APW13]